MSQHWPVADLDPVRRLQVIAATTPGVIYAEQHIAGPFGNVWAVASDLENELPSIITDVRTWITASAAGGYRHPHKAASACGHDWTSCCARAGA